MTKEKTSVSTNVFINKGEYVPKNKERFKNQQKLKGSLLNLIVNIRFERTKTKEKLRFKK